MALLIELVQASEKVGTTSRKKEKLSLLADFFRRLEDKEIGLGIRYLSGQLPQNRLGIGWRTLEEAQRNLTHRIRPLPLREVDRFFEEISREKGSGSFERKVKWLRELFSSVSKQEAEFLIRLMIGEIRQGALEGLVLEAVAVASSVPIEDLRQALMFSGDIGEVGRAALEEGLAGLFRFAPQLFHPVSPMLASPVEGEAEALERLGEAGWEYKIDGARIQIHKEGDEIRVFTRHLKDVTERVPEIVELTESFPFVNAIVEGEAIAVTDGRPLPFQTTMRRFGRIQDVDKMKREIPLISYFFDLLYVDGDSLLQRPYQERFQLLSETVPLAFRIPQIVTGDEREARAFLERSLRAGHEGVMAKALGAPYAAGRRGFHWLKIKPAQTLDLVVLAAEWGHGRRRGWLSNLHLGAADPESGRFVMLGKTFKGMTDAMLQWQTKKLLGLEISRDEWTVYVKPELVVEIAFGDLQESPRYPGGLALRFARVKQYRPDKPAAEADTIQKVWQIFDTQRGASGTG